MGKQNAVESTPGAANGGTSGTEERGIIPVGDSPASAFSPAAWTQIRTLEEAVRIAELVSKSAALPDCRNTGIALLKIMAGAEMGFGPFASLTGVDIINGKPIVGAHLKAAAIKRSDRYDFEVLERTHQICELAFFERTLASGGEVRKGRAGWLRKPQTIRYTLEEAGKSGLTVGKEGPKPNWKFHSDDMLFARCISKGYKTHCPDLTGGVRTYDADEIEGVVDAEVVPRRQESTPQQSHPPSVGAAQPDPAPPVRNDQPVAPNAAPADPITEDQFRLITMLVEKLGYTGDQLCQMLQQRFGHGSLSSLTFDQAVRVHTGLADVLIKKSRQSAAPS